MQGEGALQLVSLFLFLCVATLSHYLWHKLRLEKRWIAVRPNVFLFSSLAVLVLAIGLALLLRFERALLAVELALGFVLSVRDPVCAIGVFVAHLLLRPWEFLPDNLVMRLLPKTLAGLSLLSWLLVRLKTGTFTFFWSLPCTLYVGLLAWFTLGVVAAPDPGEAGQFVFDSFFPVTVVGFLIVNSVRQGEDLAVLRRVVSIAVVGVLGAALYITTTDPTIQSYERLRGMNFVGNANDLASLICMVLPFIIFPALIRKRSLVGTSGALIGIAILLYALKLSQSRGAMLAIAAGGFVYVLLCLRSVRQAIVAGVLVLSLSTLFFSGISRDEEDLEGSSDSRWNYTLAGLRMARAHPIFGVGIGQYPANYEFYTSSFYEWGKRTAHSSWVLVLAETGVLGFLLFIALIGSAGRLAWQMRKEYPEFLLSMVSYGTAMSFLSHSYTLLPYLLIALVIAGARVFLLGHAPAARTASPLTALLFALLFIPSVAGAEATGLRLTGVAGGDKPLPGVVPTLGSSVHLKGSRGEVLNFLVRVAGAGCGELRSGPFRASASSTPRILPLRMYRMPYINTEHPSYTGAPVGAHVDPLIPITERSTCANEKSPWMWGEVELPRETPAGTYQGELRLGEATLALTVTVWRMVIPEVPRLPGYTEMTTYYNLLGHFGEWRAGEAELSAQYSVEAYKHRMIPMSTVIARIPTIKTPRGLDLDLEQSPSPSASYMSVNLLSRPPWAYFGLPSRSPADIRLPETADYFTGMERAIQRIGRPGRAMIYLWDEPKVEDHPELITFLKLVKEKTPSLKTMVTTSYFPALEPLVDIFVPVMDYVEGDGHPKIDTYQRLRKAGKEVWWYVSCLSHGCEALADSRIPDLVIDRPAVYVRIIAWLSLRYGIDAFLYYHLNYGYQFYPTRDPWTSLWDFSGNGDGTLFYPGRPGEHGLSAHQPIPSARLKLWREASFDAEYIRWMEDLDTKPDWWTSEFEHATPSLRDWPRDYGALQSLRDRVGEYLNAQP